MYKLLIIEDEDDIRDNIKEIFELTGNEVYIATNGQEGVDLVLKVKPDLILCDIAMPVLDGFQVKKILSENKQTSLIPFVFLTARADLKSMREGMNLGADDYITKPIHAKEIIKAVYKRMGRIEELKSAQNDEILNQRLSLEDKIPLFTGKAHIFISINDIVSINVKEDYTMVLTNTENKYIVKKTIKSWESILPEKYFIRSHRSMLLNLNYIEKLEPWFNGALIAKVKFYSESVIFSKRYSLKVKKMLKNK